MNMLPSQTCWLAYYADWSEFAVFQDEVDALRFAVENHMQVTIISYGIGLREQVSNR